MYFISYNGISGNDMGVYAVTRPSIPAPELRYEETTIAGRDGTLVSSDGTYNNIEISIQLNYMSRRSEWFNMYRSIKSWLLNRDGNRHLEFSDDPDFFYKVKNVTIGTNERTSQRIGVITPTFLCEPFQYLRTGQVKKSIGKVLRNSYYTSQPVYYIEGTGKCELTVNGKKVVAEVEGNMTIDTELMISYKDDGELKNTSLTGDYMDLFLKHGENYIEVTDGFTVKVKPNWRSL